MLDCEDELLELAGAVEIAHFLEASRATVRGPYDLSLVEGSITNFARRGTHPKDPSAVETARDHWGLRYGRRGFRRCAISPRWMTSSPRSMRILPTSRPWRNRRPFMTTSVSTSNSGGAPSIGGNCWRCWAHSLNGRRPNVPAYSECFECKRRGTVCVMVARGTPCLGPVTQAGCGNLCPPHKRGCYGCFGPMETPNTASLSGWLGEAGADPGGDPRSLSQFQCRRCSIPQGKRKA